MSLSWRKPTDRRGDTIVEVMVVLAVLGMAISISYATANTSLLDARQAQDSAQAAELVASQVESLRIMAGNPVGANYIFVATPFCVTNGNAVTDIVTPTPNPNPCQFDTWYNIKVTYTAATHTFTVVASWTDVEGQGTDTDTITYRLYVPS